MSVSRFAKAPPLWILSDGDVVFQFARYSDRDYGHGRGLDADLPAQRAK
jgi:hypothetical protein